MANREHKRQIGIVCDTVPYPARSGDNQRVAELIRVLRREGWSVHFVLVGLLDKRTRQVFRGNVDAVHAYNGQAWDDLARSSLRRCVRIVDHFTNKLGIPPVEDIVSKILGRSVTPIVLDYWKRYPLGLDDFVAKLARQYAWHAAIVEYVWLYRAVQKLDSGVLRLLDTHDVQHKRVEEFASRGMTFPLQITRELEARIFTSFDAVLAIQAAEAADIRLMSPNVRVLTVGSSVSHSRDQAHSVVDGRILYVGGFNGANIDGLRRFLFTAWPNILKQHPLAHLHVCGYVYRAFLGTKYERVTFLGHMDDIEAEYARAAVIINPSWIGTGLKIKTIEALAHGKPLVTTPKGIEGLHDEVQRSILVCNVERDFVINIVHLLKDSQARARLCEAAKSFADRHLNVAAVYGELLSYLDEHTWDSLTKANGW